MTRCASCDRLRSLCTAQHNFEERRRKLFPFEGLAGFSTAMNVSVAQRSEHGSAVVIFDNDLRGPTPNSNAYVGQGKAALQRRHGAENARRAIRRSALWVIALD